MNEDRYAHINRWNVLLDELCNRAGFLDTASLAGRFCELANNGGQRDFDTAVRNLNNWRSGRHIPRRRSLRVLEQLLDVDKDPALLAQWNALYHQASDAEDDEELTPSASMRAAGQAGRMHNWLGPEVLMAGVVMFAVGLGVGLLAHSDWRPWGNPADNAPLVTYTPEVQMAVGESQTIHAERGDCGKMPRDWPLVQDSLPVSQTGMFSDGGLARRNSKFCGGMTPARAIIFTATAAGVEELRIQGDYFRITVAESAQDGGTVSQ